MPMKEADAARRDLCLEELHAPRNNIAANKSYKIRNEPPHLAIMISKSNALNRASIQYSCSIRKLLNLNISHISPCSHLNIPCYLILQPPIKYLIFPINQRTWVYNKYEEI